MKLSECLYKAADELTQCTDAYAKERGDGTVRYCAVGAILHYHHVSDKTLQGGVALGISTTTINNRSKSRLLCPHPDCDHLREVTSLAGLIIHLNDDHREDFEKIATRLKKMEEAGTIQ